MNRQKKTAPEMAVSETENRKSRKTFSINSILKNGGKVKVVVKKTDDVPRFIGVQNVPTELLSRKLRQERIGSMTLIYDPKSTDPANIAFDRTIYRGTVLVANVFENELCRMSRCDADDALVWLMGHIV